MYAAQIRASVVAAVCAVALLAGTASSAFAQPKNEQSGLVNVNIQDLGLQIPVSVALPIGLAANVCGLNVLAIQEAGNACTATTNSLALSQAVADAMIGTGGGGGPQNQQSGLVNVNVQDVIIQVPLSVAAPIGVAANVCGVNVLAIQQAGNECDAEATTQGFSQSLARALLGANP